MIDFPQNFISPMDCTTIDPLLIHCVLLQVTGMCIATRLTVAMLLVGGNREQVLLVDTKFVIS